MDRDRQASAGKTQGGQSSEQNKNVREGFGDDMGTRVGRPDEGTPDDRSMARLSENADDRGIEGAVLASSDNPTGSPGGTERGPRPGAGGGRSSTRADGSSMEGQTLDHAQRAQTGMPQSGQTGIGGEANKGVEGANIQRGTDEEGSRSAPQSDRPGSEPLSGRQSEHKPSYGGEGGDPRTGSHERERGLDYYGDEGTGKEEGKGR